MKIAQELPIIFLKHISVEDSSFLNDTYDVIYILQGECQIEQQAYSGLYSASNICIISPNTNYRIIPVEKSVILHLGLSALFVDQALGFYGSLVCDSVREPNNDFSQMRELITGISSKFLENPIENKLYIYGLLFQLLSQIKSRNFFTSVSNNTIPLKYQGRVLDIIKYVENNYSSPLTLATLSETLFLTPQYLSKFFKKYFEKNFKDYLLEYRLFHAHRDICYTNDTITEIAVRHGFSDITAFSKSFRNYYDITPSKYRKESRTRLLQQEYTTISNFSAKSLAPKDTNALNNYNISTSIADSTPFNKDFSALLNIGFIQNLLLEDFREQIISAKTDLEFKYLRMQGLTSSSFIPKIQPSYVYYFKNLTSVLDLLYENDIIPFFELSKPALLSGTYVGVNSALSSSIISSRFFNIFEAILQYCSANYPSQWTAKWIFELWKSPTETSISYIQNFKNIKTLINKYLPGSQIGGFGFESHDRVGKLSEILNQMKEDSITLDFISSHFNLHVKDDMEQNYINTNPSYMSLKLNQVREICKQYFENVPFFITEWTSAIIPNIPIQYSCFQSAFICKTALELGQYCDLMGYWIFGDIGSLPSGVENESFHFWGQGLINRDNLKMPGYYAFQLLNKLSYRLVDKGENYFISRDENNNFQILAYNYSHFSPNNAFSQDIKSSFLDTYNLFENKSTMNAVVTLNDIVPGTYRVTRFLLDRVNGSILDIWIGGFAAGNIDISDYLMNIKLSDYSLLEYYKKACIPETRTIYIEAENSLTVDTALLPHTVCLWKISKLF